MLAGVAAWPHFGALVSLSLARKPLGPLAVDQLDFWLGLAKLRGLDLDSCALADGHIGPLLDSPHRNRDTYISLAGNAPSGPVDLGNLTPSR